MDIMISMTYRYPCIPECAQTGNRCTPMITFLKLKSLYISSYVNRKTIRTAHTYSVKLIRTARFVALGRTFTTLNPALAFTNTALRAESGHHTNLKMIMKY